MILTSASAWHPVKKEGARVGMGTDDSYQDRERDTDPAGNNSEPEAAQPPPRKRTLNAAHANQAPAPKKQVRGRKGRLAGLMNMPIDIFTEIASHLLPIDIISLARTNKNFRNILMRKSSIHIWRESMKNVPGLPPCPLDMTEPHYLALLFSKTCSQCGKSARGRMDATLRVRLCGPCRDEHLISIDEIPLALQDIFHRSSEIFPLGMSWRHRHGYVLNNDIPGLLTEYDEKGLADKSELEAWTNGKVEQVNQRKKEARLLIRFLDSTDKNREKDLKDLKAARRSDIDRRVKEMGWTNEDIPSDWKFQHHDAWDALVNQPKPLTDRTWANLKPKLTTMLEASRAERLAKVRYGPLFSLFEEIKKHAAPAFTLAFSQRRGSPLTVPYFDIFPSPAHALLWPLVSKLYETGSTPEQPAINFQERRQEIEALVHEWRTRVRAHFLHQIQPARTTTPDQTLTFNASEPHIAAKCDSDDIKRLYRADSLFYSNLVPEQERVPLTYDSAITKEKLLWRRSLVRDDGSLKALSLEHIRWYPEAHEVARALLGSLGKADACCLEVRSGSKSRVYVCGRCHDTTYRTWEGMIQHYIEQKKKHSASQKVLQNLAEQRINYAYNDIHDPALETDLPLIKPRKAKAGDDGEDSDVIHVCKVCERIPSADEVVAPHSSILRHLHDVHEIDEPELDEHYALED